MRAAARCALPALLAACAAGLASTHPGSPVLIAALLVCPGWGLLRLLSTIDRRFGIAGASLCLSLLGLGLLAEAAAAAQATPEQLARAVHVATVLLCMAGGVLLWRHQRWRAAQPPPSAPMALWPTRLTLCLAVLGGALLLRSLAARDGASPAGSALVAEAARAQAWLAGPPPPLTELSSAAAAALSAASGVPPTQTCRIVAAACLAVALLFAAESLSRLRNNRGGACAMLALLLGFAPLGGLLSLGQSASARGLATALDPFVGGGSLALALACAAMLLSTTLSVLRRATFHVPRLAGAAAFGLTLCRPDLGLLLLPGWIVGIALAHRLCRHSLDNVPGPTNPVRRPGEPQVLRAPFWRLAVPIGAAGALAFWLTGAPTPALENSAGRVGELLLITVLPACLLFVPGVRQLNASPGREGWFYVGWVALCLPCALLLGAGPALARLLALLLAVPAANGALTLLEQRGRGAALALLLLLTLLLPTPLLALLAPARPVPTEPLPELQRAADVLPDAPEAEGRRAADNAEAPKLR